MDKRIMRNGQNKRMRGRNRKGGHHQNPLSRMYESNGPDVKIRGTASHVAEKYLQLARDSQSSGDPVSAENYYQHAEHYFRLIASAQEHLRQTQPSYYQQQQSGNMGDDAFDDGDGDGDGDQPMISGEPFAPREPQQFYPREQQYSQQPQYPQQQPQQQPHQFQPRPQQFQPQPANDADVERLPSFITGGQGPNQPAPQQGQGANGPGPNGANGGGNQNGNGNAYEGAADRFPLHRRRRRHRGPRDHAMPGEAEASSSPRQGDE
jgi:hypothetical protein